MRIPHPWALPTQPVSRRLLAAGGVSDEMINTAVTSGRLLRLRRGVFVAASSWPDDPRGRHVMMGHAEQVTNPDAVLSHGTAASLWGLPAPSFRDWHEEHVAVTYAAGGSYRSRGGTAVRHTGPLPASDVTRDPDGYAVTTIARTAVDVAAGLSLPEALVILDGAARQIVISFVAEPPGATSSIHDSSRHPVRLSRRCLPALRDGRHR